MAWVDTIESSKKRINKPLPRPSCAVAHFLARETSLELFQLAACIGFVQLEGEPVQRHPVVDQLRAAHAFARQCLQARARRFLALEHAERYAPAQAGALLHDIKIVDLQPAQFG